MVKHDPAERPSIDTAFEHFEKLRASLSPWTLRSRVVYEDDVALATPFRAVRHLLRTAFWMVTGTSPLPTPRGAT